MRTKRTAEDATVETSSEDWARLSRRQHRVATLCGALPLASGVAIYLLWLATDWQLLELAGVVTILLGCVLFVVGVVMLIDASEHAQRAPERLPRGSSARRVACAALLLVNFPVAGWIVRDAFRREWLGTAPPEFTVVVENRSGRTLERVALVGVHGERFGDLAPGERAARTFELETRGDVELHALDGDRALCVPLLEPAHPGLGEHVEVTLRADGDASVSYRHHDGFD